jgi:hypothetical protein
VQLVSLYLSICIRVTTGLYRFATITSVIVRFRAMLSVFLDSDAQATAFSASPTALEALFYKGKNIY